MLNLGKTLSKKVVFIFVIVLILAAAAGGFFWWKNRGIKGSPDDYVVREINQGKIMENKKAGLTIVVPEGWEYKKVKDIEGGSFIVQTSNISGKKVNDLIMPPLTQGCGIEVGVNYKKFSFTEIEQSLREIYAKLVVIEQKFEITKVNNKEALKNIVDSQYAGPMIGIYIPVIDKMYSFTLVWSSNEKEKCIQEFDRFLETVSID